MRFVFRGIDCGNSAVRCKHDGSAQVTAVYSAHTLLYSHRVLWHTGSADHCSSVLPLSSLSGYLQRAKKHLFLPGHGMSWLW
jgi:hypothetical protein